ncbi:hypothetical protein T4A_9666, partial [Trichinella pseudospiralis]
MVEDTIMISYGVVAWLIPATQKEVIGACTWSGIQKHARKGTGTHMGRNRSAMISFTYRFHWPAPRIIFQMLGNSTCSGNGSVIDSSNVKLKTTINSTWIVICDSIGQRFSTYVSASWNVTIAPYHSASNAQAERMQQTMKKALRRIVKGNSNVHHERLLLSQHINLNSKTVLCLAELLMHCRRRTLLDNLQQDGAKISIWSSSGHSQT